VDLTTDTYTGIALDVKYSLTAEMVYQGTVSKYTVKDIQPFLVQNVVN